MSTTTVSFTVIEITLACQLQLMPPAVVYRYSPDYAETQATASLVNVLPGDRPARRLRRRRRAR